MNDLFCFVDMATRFSQDRYACAKEKKNQPLSKISSPPLKKQKFGGSGGIIISSLVRTPLPFSPTVSIKELPYPPLTQKGKEKKGERIWTNPATAIGQTHNVISNDKLKTLSSIPSYELVSCHVHKLVQESIPQIVSSRTYVFVCLYIYLLSSGPQGIVAPNDKLSLERGEGCDGQFEGRGS